MINPIKDELYKEVATLTGHDPFDVYEAISAMFKVVVVEMDGDRTNPVRIPYLGLFMCKPARLEKLGLTTTADGTIKRTTTNTREELLGDIPTGEDN